MLNLKPVINTVWRNWSVLSKIDFEQKNYLFRSSIHPIHLCAIQLQPITLHFSSINYLYKHFYFRCFRWTKSLTSNSSANFSYEFLKIALTFSTFNSADQWHPFSLGSLFTHQHCTVSLTEFHQLIGSICIHNGPPTGQN